MCHRICPASSRIFFVMLAFVYLVVPSTQADRLGNREGVRKKDSSHTGAMPSWGIRGGYLGGGNFSISGDYGSTDWGSSGSYTAGLFFDGTLSGRLMTGVAIDFSNIVIDEVDGRKLSSLWGDRSAIFYELSFGLKYNVSAPTARWNFRPYGSVGVGAANKIEPYLDRSLAVTARTGVEALFKTGGRVGVIFDGGLFWLLTGNTKTFGNSGTVSGGPAPYARVGFRVGRR